MVQKATFRIDLNKIEGEGEFPCPSCGIIISPEDEPGITYETVEVNTDEDGTLKELVILCKKCRSIIRLEGFEMLEKLEKVNETSVSDEE